MREISADLNRWLSVGEKVALATVVWAEGPSPRPLGSRMAVTASGQMTGSVSGGCVEGAVFEEAQAVLSGGSPRRLRYGTADETGWEVGLACGGTIEVYVERFVDVLTRALFPQGPGRVLDFLGGLQHVSLHRFRGPRRAAARKTAKLRCPAAAPCRHSSSATVADVLVNADRLTG